MSWDNSGRHCWVLRFFTTQAKCIHEGGTEQSSRVSPSCLHVSSTGWLGGIYTPNPYYIMTSMPLLVRNILQIFRAVGHFTGWNVQVVYSIRFVLGTPSRRSSATFGSSPDLQTISRSFGGSLKLRILGVTFGLREPSASSEDLRLRPKTFSRTPVPSASSEDLRPYSRTFGFRPVAWGNLRYARWRSPTPNSNYRKETTFQEYTKK